MTDTAISAQQPSQQPATKQTRHHEPKVTGKVREALDLMIWQGLPRKAAAEQAGISEHGLYKALRKPAVKALYMSELEVLRTSEKARSIHRIAEIRDSADNMPALKASLYFAEDSRESAARSMGSVSLPGLTIMIVHNQEPPAEPRTIEHDEVPK